MSGVEDAATDDSGDKVKRQFTFRKIPSKSNTAKESTEAPKKKIKGQLPERCSERVLKTKKGTVIYLSVTNVTMKK